MYKHLPRILFICSDPVLAQFAAKYANEAGEGVIEAESLQLGQERSQLVWADLVVCLGQGAFPHIVVPPGGQKKTWEIEVGSGLALFEEIQARVDGLIGGVRMMS